MKSTHNVRSLLTSLNETSCKALRETLLSCADLSCTEIRGKSHVSSGWHFNSLCFHLRRDASRQWSVCTLLPQYCGRTCLNRIASPPEPESLHAVSLTSLCPVSDTPLWGSWLPERSLLWELPLFHWLKTKNSVCAEMLWEEKTARAISSRHWKKASWKKINGKKCSSQTAEITPCVAPC